MKTNAYTFLIIGAICNIIGCLFNLSFQLCRLLAGVQVPALVITAGVFVGAAVVLIIISCVKLVRGLRV